VAACLWGTSGIFSVRLFELGVSPETVALGRPLAGLAGLFVGFGLARRPLAASLRDAALLAGGGGAFVALFQIAYQLSTEAVGVPATVALLYLAPALVAAGAGPLLGEWPTRSRVGLVLLTLCGVWATVAGAIVHDSPGRLVGLVWGALTGVSYAGYTLFGRWATPRFGAERTVFYSTAGACVALVATLPWMTSSVASPEGASAWLLLVAFGALTVGVAQLLFFDALGRVEATGASVMTAAEPAVATVLASLLLSQGLSPLGWAGVMMIVVGVVAAPFTANGGNAP